MHAVPLVVLACAMTLAGCTGQPSEPADAANPSSSAAPTSSERPGKLPPLPGGDAGAPSRERPAEVPSTTATADGFTRECSDAVTASSGAQLRVILGQGVTDCPMAVRLVRAFHRKIDQPAGSRHPAKATVDGWDCVSGPPSSQGGTTCGNGDREIFAAVAEE